MDGSPLARLAVVLIFLVLMGLPVVALTQGKPAAVAEDTKPARAKVEEQSVDFAVTLSQPGKVEIRLADKVLLTSEGAVPSLEKTVTLPGGRSDLTVKFQWADGTSSHAGRLVVSRDGDVVADQTYWGETEAEDVLNVQMPQP